MAAQIRASVWLMAPLAMAWSVWSRLSFGGALIEVF
jgi:hypothetical protein